MPQMAPLSWLSLMIFFILIFLTFNLINFSVNSNFPKSSKLNKSLTYKIWKW
uniref:ATP synthase complex subunit 8 n=2 Tax=Lucanus TaxID=41108 RepID=A0A650BXT8_LUCCE|nr:ATP synthase F0 subunit 8 [Lucanus cervus]APO08641.1 ATP synthase F0 subunit 8 [Lucanus sp. BMNH 1425267]QDW75833.1 ATP synthase F0 subunit 8 [Lucanus cervus]QGQ62200.1 ATP synthase F0 subunit 8 [Lucanus cervus]UIN24721.1 ATP synthase F0 subunit 8 [Lucanus cervus]